MPDYDDWEKITSDSRDLISRMLTVKSMDRITGEDALAHPWISQRETRAPSIHREAAEKRLHEFNAQRRIKAVALAVALVTHPSLLTPNASMTLSRGDSTTSNE